MRGIGYVIAAAVFSLGATPAHGGAIRPTTEAATPPAHHLYVAIGCTPNPPHVAVLRYGLASGGTISESPDLVYDGAGAPLSIGTQGELYAGNGLGECGYGPTVNVYPRGRNRPVRTLTIPTEPQPLQVTALARDAADDLYVGYLGGTIPRTPQLGTFVFGPKAHGMPAPLQAIPSAGVVQGLAFDEAGMLYVSERATPGIFTQGQSVRVFSDPATKPTFVREIAGTSFAAPLTTSGISIAAGELYVANLQTAFPAGGSDSVSAYRTSASGRVRPDRTIVPQGGDEAFAALGVVASDGLLFITFTGQTLRAPSGVYVFDATQSGVIKPKDMLFAPDGTTVEALAVGP